MEGETLMGYFIQVLLTMFSIFPSWVTIFFFGIISIALIVLVVKIVGFVLDAIPFL